MEDLSKLISSNRSSVKIRGGVWGLRCGMSPINQRYLVKAQIQLFTSCFCQHGPNRADIRDALNSVPCVTKEDAFP